MAEAYVKSELHKGIATIEFFHPQRNSLPGKILEELTNAILAAGNDDKVKVIILCSASENLPAGKAGVFCAGASFDELSAINSEEEGLKFFSGFANVINAMRTCPKFIIGRIHGKCIGGGVGLAAAADYAIAIEGADCPMFPDRPSSIAPCPITAAVSTIPAAVAIGTETGADAPPVIAVAPIAASWILPALSSILFKLLLAPSNAFVFIVSNL